MRSAETINSTSLVLPAVVQITFVHAVFVHLLYMLCFSCLVCIVVSCLEGTGVDVLRVLLSSYGYCCTMGVLLYFTLDAGLLARSQHSEGPGTGHLDTGFT